MEKKVSRHAPCQASIRHARNPYSTIYVGAGMHHTPHAYRERVLQACGTSSYHFGLFPTTDDWLKIRMACTTTLTACWRQHPCTLVMHAHTRSPRIGSMVGVFAMGLPNPNPKPKPKRTAVFCRVTNERATGCRRGRSRKGCVLRCQRSYHTYSQYSG